VLEEYSPAGSRDRDQFGSGAKPHKLKINIERECSIMIFVQISFFF